MSKIIINHGGKLYEVEGFSISSTHNGHIRVKFNNGICPECGNDAFWIFASEAKPVTRDAGSAKLDFTNHQTKEQS